MTQLRAYWNEIFTPEDCMGQAGKTRSWEESGEIVGYAKSTWTYAIVRRGKNGILVEVPLHNITRTERLDK